MTSVENIHDLNMKMKAFVDMLTEQTSAFSILITTKADLEREMAKMVQLYLDENPNMRKPSFEKLELLAAKTQEQRTNLYHLVWLRSKVKLAEVMLDSIKTGISAIQSQMRFNSGYVPYNGNGER